mgnify:CR=1 FL=1
MTKSGQNPAAIVLSCIDSRVPPEIIFDQGVVSRIHFYMSKEQELGKAFDFKLFKRLFKYIQPYKGVFFGLVVLVILLAGLSAATPYITKYAIDDSIASKESKDFLFYIFIMLAVLLFQTVFQFEWIMYPNKNDGFYGGYTLLYQYNKMTNYYDNKIFYVETCHSKPFKGIIEIFWIT